LHTSGVAGVSVPRAEALRGLLLSLDRGLIATSPLFVLVPFGLYRLVRTERGPMAALIGVTAAYYLVFVSGADVWYAGWAFGPRLLVPVMGLSMLPAAAALEWAKRKPFVFGAAVGCVAAGILYHQTVHVVFPEPPPHLKNPVLDIVVPALARGVLSPNRAAELSGAPGLWTLVFPGMATLGVIYVLYRRTSGIANSARDRAGAVAGALLAPALLTAAVMIAGPSVPERRHHRFADWMLELEHCETAECSRAGDWTAREEPGIQ
ncbi:MAG: hypothetical protein ACM3XQ_02245, partial [Nocardioidaceae bacterium]